MRKPCPCTLTLTLGALAFPATVSGGSYLGNPRNKKHFAGLGDGNVDTAAQQGLRGATGNKRKRTAAGRNDWRDRGGTGSDRSDYLHAPAHVRDDNVKDSSLRNTNAAGFRRGASATGDGGIGTDRLGDVEFMDYMRKGGDVRPTMVRREDAPGSGGEQTPPQASDGPWQLSILVLLGIVGVLMGLFVHFSTDPTGQTPYFRRRIPKKKIHRPDYKKTDSNKPDYWSEEDEEVMAEDVNYSGDTEGSMGGGGSIAKKRSPMPKAPDDPTAGLYYQMKTSNDFRREESARLRKSATATTQQQSQPSSGVSKHVLRSPSRPTSSRPSATVAASGNVGGRGKAAAGTTGSSSSPFPTSPYIRSSASRSSTPSRNDNPRRIEKTTSKPIPSPPFRPATYNSGIGSGLEGFDHLSSQRSGSSSDAAKANSADKNDVVPAFKAGPLVKPMGTFTPTGSFASMTLVSAHQKGAASNTTSKGASDGDFSTPPVSVEEQSSSVSYLSASSPWQSGDYSSQYSETLSELPTPRVVNHTREKLKLAQATREKCSEIGDVPPSSFLSVEDTVVSEGPLGDDHIENVVVPTTENNSSICDLADAFPGLPLVPNLHATTGDGSSGFHVDAPRSLALEELQLVRMESGVSGPKWRTKYELEQNAASAEERRQKSENEEKLREASSAIDPADDPRPSIQHIRKDLTTSSDASSSLSSKITFSELKLEDVIGGGGFGQVWRARWKGTPVAVKVLTGLAQAETVPKAVLEEFIAEINMVSGMRHPNICLFMGACLEPPNRAIVTELCENGSMWDALRSPLSAYEVADGMTRLAWPLNLYEPMISPPPTFQEGHHALSTIEPPLVPSGAWPWVLVKRVAAGTARGMCYLHSGNPPVLHRDLKSANILLDESYTAKLADFGLSRLKAVRSGMTGNCGTVQWMAPEVLCNENYAEPADVFSFGIILWEMLTKECPYDGMSPIQCALSVLNENNRPEIPEWCPPSLKALIQNCVERDPCSRPTFTQILSALDALP